MKQTLVNILWWLLNKSLLLGGLMGFSVCLAQGIAVKDPVVNDFLCERYPLAMNQDCSGLDTARLNAIYTTRQVVVLINQGIKSADELTYFKHLDTLYLGRNQLSSFPTDLRSWYPMGWLSLTGNRMMEAPTYLVAGSPSAKKGLGFLYLERNQLQELPAEWNGPNEVTKIIALDENYLSALPDFGGYTQLRRLALNLNELSFEELLPIKQYPRYSRITFDLFPQRPFELNLSRTAYFLGESFSISVQKRALGNTYYVFKNGLPIDSNRVGEFTIRLDKSTDFGDYQLIVRNDAFDQPEEFLESHTYPITRTLVEIKNTLVFSPNQDGIEDDLLIQGTGRADFIDAKGNRLRSQELPYIWKGDDDKGRVQPPGLYIIKQSNGEDLQVLIAY